MISRSHIEKFLLEMKPMLEEKFKVKRIGCFGSFVRGDATEESDIDILVEFSESPGWDFFVLQEQLEKKFGRKVDLVTVAALKQQLERTVLDSVRYVF